MPENTWAKVELPAELNDKVEQYQRENDLTKPVAIQEMLRNHAEYLQL